MNDLKSVFSAGCDPTGTRSNRGTLTLGTVRPRIPSSVGRSPKVICPNGTQHIGLMKHHQACLYDFLVGGDWNMTFIFPYTGNNHPN